MYSFARVPLARELSVGATCGHSDTWLGQAELTLPWLIPMLAGDSSSQAITVKQTSTVAPPSFSVAPANAIDEKAVERRWSAGQTPDVV